ncbi:MAG: dephospho-CoA kinase [Actinomycetota bacterium]|nr:dephospho-CoA kinase [Actinomycetota bacterium]
MSSLLTERGALVVDTDVVARQVVAPGGPAYDALVRRFGPTLAADRRALAGVVFSDPSALADLNGIVHPAVREEVARRMAELREEGADVVVLAVPLLVETGGAYGVDAVVVVDCPEDIAVRRLVEQRGMDEADVRRRMAAQASRDERVAIADVVIHNDASMEDLESQADETWEWIQDLLAEQP